MEVAAPRVTPMPAKDPWRQTAISSLVLTSPGCTARWRSPRWRPAARLRAREGASPLASEGSRSLTSEGYRRPCIQAATRSSEPATKATSARSPYSDGSSTISSREASRPTSLRDQSEVKLLHPRISRRTAATSQSTYTWLDLRPATTVQTSAASGPARLRTKLTCCKSTRWRCCRALRRQEQPSPASTPGDRPPLLRSPSCPRGGRPPASRRHG